MSDNVISFEDAKAERMASHATVSYTAPFLIEETRDGSWTLMAEGVSGADRDLFILYAFARMPLTEARELWRKIGATLGVEVG